MIYEGTLHSYYATGEGWHLYVWTGEPSDQHDFSDKHVLVEPWDILYLDVEGKKYFYEIPWDFYGRKKNKRTDLIAKSIDKPVKLIRLNFGEVV